MVKAYHFRLYATTPRMCDLEKKWLPIMDGALRPFARAGHSCSMVGENMVIFGGAQAERRYSDVCLFNINKKRWYFPTITGAGPTERFGHTQVTVSDENILIIGGCGYRNTEFSDVWLLNVNCWTWHEVAVNDKIYEAPQLWSHPAVMVNTTVVVFSRPKRPTKRSAALYLQTPQTPMLMYLLDCCELETSHSCRWKNVLSSRNQSIPTTSLHSVDVGDNMILIFGGLEDRETIQTTHNALIMVSPFW
ncbi:F-box only protein 42-like isoform X2 [Xenia sp. Carnegie-2017]|uniref:F-box only protein 42-like isoform X2 n=1 Tax=Xenia sp. Carnegie-2017 TaxID=2897299 RepID=UPI001F046FB2|nr:F-box only protein 42-like isoform X2 [Xenia sp. Carnegie-2017]